MRVKSLVAVFALILLVTLVVSAQDAKPKPIRLVKPWNQLTSLSDEQKSKINDIHLKANAAKNEIEKKERTDIVGLLSDQQKAELKKVEDADKAAAKERSAGQAKEE